MIAGLVSYHDWVGVQIVEDTLEHVRIGNLFLSKINFDVLLFLKKSRINKTPFYSRSGNERCQIQSTTTGCG